MATTTTKTPKAPNFTDEQTAKLREAYMASPTRETVDALAAEFGKSDRSIIQKLVREGIYQKPVYKTKTGELPQPKNDLADAIGRVLRMSEPETESLTKANKAALSKIWAMICESRPAEATE